MPKLYHGTLARHLPAIQAEGLKPGIGAFTRGSYGENAEGLLPAIYFGDKRNLERVVHAMVAVLPEEIEDEDYDAYDIDADYHLNDELFCKYGAIVLVERTESFARQGKPHPGTVEPLQTEHGDWYSLSPVAVVEVLTGDALMEFLSDNGIVPSDINDFVDETRPARASASRGRP